MEIASAMKKRILVLFAIISGLLMPGICFAIDNVIITEVLYDPTNTETGGEAVEIYNPTQTEINISGFILKTESSATDAIIPQGTTLKPKTFYLIADSGWSTLKDNASWANADHEEPITMSNTDSGIAIAFPNGTIIDAVGWGNATGITGNLFEGTPATGVLEGKSLSRDNYLDTTNNMADFSQSTPNLMNSSFQEQTTQNETTESNNTQIISIGVNVENEIPIIDSIEISDSDDEIQGIQILPNPGATTNVEVNVQTTDPDGTTDISSVSIKLESSELNIEYELSQTEQINSTTAKYSGNFPMQFYYDPGIYNLTLTVTDSQTIKKETTQCEYLSMTSITIDSGNLEFPNAKIGGTTHILGDHAMSSASLPTIKNTGNTPIDIGIYGTDLTDNSKKITVENIKYSFDNDFSSEMSGFLSKTIKPANIDLFNGELSTSALGFQLYIPQGTANGNYTGQIAIAAIGK